MNNHHMMNFQFQMIKDIQQLVGEDLGKLLFMIWLKKNKFSKQEVINYYLGRLKIIYTIEILKIIFVALIWRPCREMNTKYDMNITK